MITVTLATNKRQRNAALAFIRRIARKWHACRPPPPPDILFVAKQHSRIMGTIALDFRDSDKHFPLERMYRFNQALTPFPFRREDIAQCGRWMACMPHVSHVLMYKAARYALQQGKRYALCEAKKPILHRLSELGIQVSYIPYARLLQVRVPPQEKGYYGTAPFPRLFMMQFAQMVKVLGKKDLRKHVAKSRHKSA